MAGDAHTTHDIVVMGGGISGLVCAWKLAVAGQDVVLLEKEQTPGGVLGTQQEEGWLMERGPNSITYKENDDIHAVIRELELEDQLLARSMRDSDRYIWRAGALRRVPVSPLQLLRKNAFSRRTVARAATGFWKKLNLPDHDISVGAFFSPVLGRQAVDQVLGPVMAGIYAADPFSLSFEAVMPGLHKAAKSSGTFVGAMKAMKSAGAESAKTGGQRMLASFTGGMRTLTEQLAKQAVKAGAKVLPSFEISKVERADDGTWEVTGADGHTVRGRRVVCALPANAAATVLHDAAPEAAVLLSRIRYVPMVAACVGVKESDVGITHSGFGYLAVRDTRSRCLGMIWNDRMFSGRAPEGHRLFTVFLGGQIDSAISELTDEEVMEIVKHDLRVVMKWTGNEPTMSSIRRIPAAIPLLEVGHLGRVRLARQVMPAQLHLAGNYVAGVSVPSCIRAGIELAQGITDEIGKADETARHAGATGDRDLR